MSSFIKGQSPSKISVEKESSEERRHTHSDVFSCFVHKDKMLDMNGAVSLQLQELNYTETKFKAEMH